MTRARRGTGGRVARRTAKVHDHSGPVKPSDGAAEAGGAQPADVQSRGGRSAAASRAARAARPPERSGALGPPRVTALGGPGGKPPGQSRFGRVTVTVNAARPSLPRVLEDQQLTTVVPIAKVEPDRGRQ
jgi:hypothetical protein